MAVRQLPAEIVAFTGWLGELAGRLAPDEGWYGVFRARDPEGMRACFDGTDILPWDVVASLLQDLGEPSDGPLALRGRALHDAAAAVHDRAPGGAQSLTGRRDLMERAAYDAQARIRDLAARPDRDPDGASLAWARDDLTRARARIAELDARLDRLGLLDRQGQGRLGRPGRGGAPAGTTGRPHPGAAAATPAAQAALAPTPVSAPAPVTAAAPVPALRRPRGARYAGLEVADPVLPVGLPATEPPTAPAAAPRGARFGGVSAAPARTTAAPEAPEDPERAARAAGNAVHALRRLRAQGRSGEAHALLCEALAGPPAWLPVLAAELHAAGLAADWATLLWEAATLPPGRLAAVAGALADAGRPQDCEQLLRQGVARPVEELAGACAALYAESRHDEALTLLTAFVRCRTPEDAARLAAAGPDAGPAALTAGLLAAARSVSPERARDVRHALRVAGLA
ncbi:UL36 very large tegument protein [Streptomyces roseoviridis]|uniref:UL36 very large tegument protein n=1 Tax=Streptomyces roseoviridis TaxID=67361 RepID=A0ABV5QTH4_9ACTN